MFQLAATTFLLFFGMGAFGPILSLYLVNYLHFTDLQAGTVLALSSTSVIVAPLVGSFIADRIIPAERMLSLCLLGASVLLFFLFHARGFGTFVLIYLFYVMLLAPCSSLNNAVIFHHVKDRKRDYGPIRVFGTLGWIAVAWCFSWIRLRNGDGMLLSQRLPEAILLAAITFAVLAVLAFFIPVSRSQKKEDHSFLPVESFKVVLKPQIVFLAVISFISVVVDRFYIYGSSLFLAQSGVPVHSVLPLLSVGQILEIPAMLLLGTILMRFGIRNLLVMGVASNIARYFFFIISEGNPTLMVCGILFHGLAYTFFFSSAAILLDSHSHVRNRAGVHQIFNVLTLGLGSLAGSLLAGGMGKLLRTANGLSVDFDRFWSVALGLCVVNLFLLVFLAGKGEKNGGKNPPQSWLEAE